MAFNFDSIDDTQFEEFCYDTLASLDFHNLSWRKGTGLQSSPSDQGRDIQGLLTRNDVDGSQHNETWFIECKHYKKGVPPDKIQGALSWAVAERPDVLLIVVSNYLSNPCKKYLEDYRKNNKPPFRIKVWELKDLENVTAGNEKLRRKYDLSTGISFLDDVNKYHLMYSLKEHYNSIDYFIEAMDRLDATIRDKVFFGTYVEYIKPKMRTPVTGQESLSELAIDSIDYANFKSTILSLVEPSPRLIHQLVTSEIGMYFSLSDKTTLKDKEENYRLLLERINKKVAESVDENEKLVNEKMLQKFSLMLEELPVKMDKQYKDYEYICNELLKKLLVEKL